MSTSMSKGEFINAAEAILHGIIENGGVTANDISKIITNGGWTNFNCYPGIPSSSCHRLAFFVSITSRKNARGIGHLSFRNILEKCVQHLQGSCQGITSSVVLITDNWEPDAWDDWSQNINQIKKSGVFLEMYMIASRSVSIVNL